ncbi:tetratricopeptide repeat protein [Mycobacterium sp. NPDC050441]|uniref:tetratricopeptide repeat protein n=1 Tax=Mycobacterium sp. NPDC050441 TaxID=3155403 RepID=UPI00340AA870
MPISLSGRNVFLASPGDLASERQVCRDVVRSFNESRANLDGVHFMVRAWEQMPGGIGRPQGRINAVIDDCDFMILMFAERWGTAPATAGLYSSGTEEEFFRGVELIGLSEASMRDILVLFRTVDASRLRDPGDELKKVVAFRGALEKSHVLTYSSFDSIESLTVAINLKLAEWAKPLEDREVRRIAISLSEEVAGTQEGQSPSEFLQRALELWKQSLYTQAESAFSHAIADGNPEAMSRFASFMRRTGRPEKAIELNKQLLGDPNLLRRNDAEAIGYRVKSLANLGIIYRKKGDLAQSQRVLDEAVKTANSSPQVINRQLCYALDNYGFTLMKLDRPEDAVEQFEEAKKLRTNFGSEPADIAQSEINLGRAKLFLQEYEAAEVNFNSALDILPEGARDSPLRANALAGSAEARIRARRTEGVGELLSEALETNQTLMNSDGVSICMGLQARLALASGDIGGAQSLAERCQEESERALNLGGRATAAWLLAEVASAKQRIDDAKMHLKEARELSRNDPDSLFKLDLDSTAAKLNVDD